MTGPMRALCYQLASATGLRFSEIASTTESFDWKAPSVVVNAAYTKNGDPATMPLPRGPGGRSGRLRGDVRARHAHLPDATTRKGG